MEQYLKNKYYQITNGKQLNINIKSDPIKQLKQEINYFKSFVSIVKEYCENVGLQLFINTEKNQSDKGYISQVIINEKTFCQGSDLIKKISREIACEKFIQKCLNQDFEVNEEDYYDQGEEVSNSLDFSKLDYYDPLVNYLYFLQVFQNYSKIPNFKFRFKDKQGQNEVVDFTYKDLQEEGVGITKFQAKNQAIFKMLQTLKKTNEFQNFMKKLPENQNQESLKQPNIRKRQRKQRKQKQTFQNSKLIKKQKSNDIQQLILIDLDSQANKIKYNQTQQDISKETQSEKQSQIKEEMLFKKRETNQLGNQTDQNKDQHSQFIQIIQELKQKEQNQNQSNQTLDSLSLNEIIPVQNNESQIKQVNKIQPTQESQNSQDKQLKSKSQSQNKQAKGDEIILDDQNSKQPIVITDYDKTPKNTSFIQDRSVILINIDQEVSQQENLKILSNINSNQSNQLFKSQQNEPEESKSNEVNSQNTEQINSKCQNNNQINLEVSKYLDQKLFRVANSALYNSLTQKVFEYLSYNSISQETYIQIANMIDNIDVFSQECQLGVVFFQIVGSLFYKIVCKDQVIGDIVIVCDSSISNQSEENTKLEIFKKIKQLSVGSKVQQYFNCMSLKNNKIKLKIYIEFIQDKFLSLELHHWNYMKCYHQFILQSQSIQSIFIAVRRLRSFYLNKINVCILDAFIIFVTKQLQYIEPCQNIIDIINLIILIGNYPQIDNLIFLENFMEFHKKMIKKDLNELKNLSLLLKDLPKEKIFDFLNIQQLNQEAINNEVLLIQ
ncbi:hypothetical protein TTHERM_01106170 (macronuclear) [Tetrahymena thermophila SB210]|uniref:Uncharacterized protein n=1 Tax=Tetrahymena thermophila (strain SB210) TaxID=312017 RepID=Q22BE0_TETTS|nr:hypothetical protein TTHERM_01106170 [Tetrahymena thermophila SB210]EAR82615.4 hypothetical protein TTHERM_01106170 [Tetrahymena thermophila SB210]|eukprot:XP_001030278.4 hypothetical protein TTHERM_01106170 [Tetrahymena thermophila SB210]